MKIIITIIFILNCFNSVYSQDFNQIKTLEEAQQFVQNYKDKIPPLEDGVSEEEAYNFFLNYNNEGPKLKEIITVKDSINYYQKKLTNFNSKVVDISNINNFRVSYVYLNGEQLTTQKINDLRIKIISDYKKGISFSSLAKQYTMDNSVEGDLGWFSEGDMVKEFEDEVKIHKKGEIFTVDIPEHKWFYVVLKTFDTIEKIKLTYILKK